MTDTDDPGGCEPSSATSGKGADCIYRQLLEMMSEGAATLSADGVIRTCNVHLAEMLGRPLEELLDSALLTYLPPPDQLTFGDALAQARVEPGCRELSLETAEGRLLPVALSVSSSRGEGEEPLFLVVVRDLTQEKHDERSSAEERLARSILEQTAEAIVVCDEQGRLIRASDSARRLCDGGPLLRPFEEVFPLRAGALGPFRLAPVLQGETLRNAEVFLERLGRRLDLIVNAGPLLSGPRVIGCVVTLTDITERKAAEEALREREENLRYIIRHDPNAIAVYDLNLHYLAVSDRYLRDYDVREGSLIGRHHYDVFPEMPQRWKDVHQRCLGGAIERQDDDSFERPDGSTTYNRWECRPWYRADGKIGGIVTYTEVTTERKNAERALRESEAKFRLLAESIQDVFWISTPASPGMVYVSPAFERIWGRPCDWIHQRPESFVDTIHPDDRSRVLAADRERNREAWSIEYRIIRADGVIRWILDRGYPVLDGRGELVQVCGVATDITERKRSEEDLRASQQLIEGVINAIPVRVFWKDRSLVYLGCNAAFARDAGFADPKDLIGKDDFQMGWRHEAELYRRDDRQVIESGCAKSLIEEPQTTPGGDTITLLTSKIPLRGPTGEVTGVLGTYMDITERKRAEAAVRESEARLMGVVDSAMDGIVTIDDQERVVVFNAAAEAMFGCSAGEALGQLLERFIPERFRDAHHGHLQRFGQMGEATRAALMHRRIVGLRAGGVEFPIEASISRTEVEGHLLFTIILRDITERVRSEEAREQLEAQLHLGQKLEALGALAGGIAHDFNNVLGTIIGNTELATQDVGAGHAAIESLEEIRKASQRAKELVRRILAFGSPNLEPRSVIPLRPVVEEALTLLRATLPAGVEIAATIDDGAPTVLASAAQVHQVLVNLCTNAWHATKGGSGRIEIRLDGVTLDADAARADVNLRPGHFARLSVTDNGIGIEAGTMLRIFDPFFTTKPLGEGTGLGLCVVHGTMKAHGGAVTVTSQLGIGSTFSLYFPAVAGPAAGAAPVGAAAEDRPVAGGRHVLFLDDEEQLVFLVSRVLRRQGYAVSGYTRAEEALAAVRADPGRFDLVVTDFNMPVVSGLEVAREVSRLRPELPVVLASGYITDELRAEASEAGVRELIYKPNTVEELCDVVGRLARPASVS